jgi:hypothetical protein
MRLSATGRIRFAVLATIGPREQDRGECGQLGGVSRPGLDPDQRYRPGRLLRHCGGLPCLRDGSSVCLCRSMASERISTRRVSPGSMTSSTRPRSAA